jgi:hypothetical protein
MNDQIGAQWEGLLQGGGTETIVHHQQAAVRVGEIGQRSDIGQLHQRIGRGFQVEQPGFRADRGFPGGEIGQGDVAGGDAELAQVVGEQRNRAAENAVGRDDVVAALQQRHAGRQDRRHPRRGGDAGFAAFQRRQPLLEHAHGRVGEAGVDVARDRAAEAGGGFGGIGEHETGSGENRFGVFAFEGALLAGAHRQAGETEFGNIVDGHVRASPR